MTFWPEGVIARYLNVGGAPVDITDDTRIARVSARCHGCTWSDYHCTGGLSTDTADQVAEHLAEVLPGVRALAQQHAEVCRATSKPDN